MVMMTVEEGGAESIDTGDGGRGGGADHDETLSTHWKGVQHICTPSHTHRLCTQNAARRHMCTVVHITSTRSNNVFFPPLTVLCTFLASQDALEVMGVSE